MLFLLVRINIIKALIGNKKQRYLRASPAVEIKDFIKRTLKSIIGYALRKTI
jgi:hypothetical protein